MRLHSYSFMITNDSTQVTNKELCEDGLMSYFSLDINELRLQNGATPRSYTDIAASVFVRLPVVVRDD